MINNHIAYDELETKNKQKHGNCTFELIILCHVLHKTKHKIVLKFVYINHYKTKWIMMIYLVQGFLYLIVVTLIRIVFILH
jgi:hypothetical protein